MTSLEEKELGAAAWSAGNYPLAITHFTNAIEIGGDKEFIKVIYSNRSVANVMVLKYKDALTDANKCIEIDGNWAKGYTRKGDAQYKLMQYTDAYNAYNSAKRLSPNDKSLEEKCDLAMKAIGMEADRAAGSSARSARGSSTSATTAVSPSGIIGKVITYSRYLLILAAFLYLIPLQFIFGRTFSFICAKVFAVAEIVINILSLYSKYGIPKFNMEYGYKLMQDTVSIHLFLAIILVVSRAYMFAMAPILLTELSYMSGYLFTYCRENIGPMEAQIKPMIMRFMPALANQDMSMLFNAAAEKQFSFQLVRNAAMCEVMQGVFLIVEMILPTRNLVMAVMWWQYLQMRYMMDKQGHVKAAFFGLDQRISTVISHRLCPKLLGRGYDLLKKFLADKVKPPQAQSGGATPSISSMFSSLKSKCNIM